jgi:hypothetical protein
MDQIHCLACDCELILHQPDPDLPDRLLGTCDECKSWFLIEGVECMPVPLSVVEWGNHKPAA